MLRRLTIVAFVLLFLVLILAALWNVFDWPPPRLVLKYGFPPAGGPTGRTMTIEGVEFVELRPAFFRMGSHFRCENGDLLGRVSALLHLPWGKQPEHDGAACPPRWVEIRRSFWLARTELTNFQLERFSSAWQRDILARGDRYPAINLDRSTSQEYCRWLSTRGPLAVRLPSEAEWEYACRAGSSAVFSFGDDNGRLSEYAWFGDNAGSKPHPVATRRANPWGFFDVYGNTKEWCEDAYHEGYHGAPVDETPWTENGSVGFDGGPIFVLRGGWFLSHWFQCTAVSRGLCGIGMIDSSSHDPGLRPAADLR